MKRNISLRMNWVSMQAKGTHTSTHTHTHTNTHTIEFTIEFNVRNPNR